MLTSSYYDRHGLPAFIDHPWIYQTVAETSTGIEGVVDYNVREDILEFRPLSKCPYWDAPRWLRTYKELWLLDRLAKQYEVEQEKALASERR